MFTVPLPHDEAAELASFRQAFASAMQKADPVCSPPAQDPTLVSGDSGAALVGGNPPLKPVFCFNHVQIPNGFWFRICGGHCKTFFTPWNNFDNVRVRSA